MSPRSPGPAQTPSGPGFWGPSGAALLPLGLKGLNPTAVVLLAMALKEALVLELLAAAPLVCPTDAPPPPRRQISC